MLGGGGGGKDDIAQGGGSDAAKVDEALRAVEARVARAEDGYEVTVTATALVKDVGLLVDVVDPDATVDDMLRTLLPGEQATFRVRCGELADPQALVRPDVLRSTNQLVGG